MNDRGSTRSALRVARLVVIVLIDAVALFVLAGILSGFNLNGAVAAIVLAVVLGIGNAVVWPFIVRVALPFTVLTLGLGALLLNAALLLGVDALLDDVEVRDLWSALVIVLGLSALTTIAGGVLALDEGGLWYRHVVRRQLKRSDLAVHTDVPGLLLLEIDGLAHDVLRRALRDGNAPVLARWAHGDHRLEGWETGWSSQTGACQAGLLHGNDDDMPAFRWWEKDLGRAIVTNHPKDAAEIERRHSDGRGLLFADGASRANILSGDAPHSMLTMSTVLDRDRPGRLGQDYFAYFASPFGVARTLLRSLWEVVVERWWALEQGRRDVLPRIHRGWEYAFVRAYATVVQLDLQVASVTSDILAGRPVVYTTFLAYDEVAHHSGVERPDALTVLRRVDDAVGRIAAAVPHAPRPYRIVVLSDHGQSQGATFLQRFGERLEDVVARHVDAEVRAEEAQSDEGGASLRAGVSELASRDSATGHAVRTAAGKRLDEPERGAGRARGVGHGLREPRARLLPARARPRDPRGDRGAPPRARRRAAHAPGDRVPARALGGGRPARPRPGRAAAAARRPRRGRRPAGAVRPERGRPRPAHGRLHALPRHRRERPLVGGPRRGRRVRGARRLARRAWAAGSPIRSCCTPPTSRGPTSRSWARRRSTRSCASWLASLGQEDYASSASPGESVTTRVPGAAEATAAANATGGSSSTLA